MPRARRMRFVGSDRIAPAWVAAHAATVHLIDFLAANWTEKQSHAVAGALQGWTQERIARSWQRRPISQQAVAQHLDRAGWHAIEHGLRFYERQVGEA